MTVQSTGIKRVTIQVYIPDNKELFGALNAQRQQIEAELGMVNGIDWRELPAKKACRIVASHEGDFLNDSESPALVEWMVETADQFARVFQKYL